jgi:type IV pilus assembly protein PilO
MSIDFKDIKTQITIGLVVLSVVIAALFYFLKFKPTGDYMSQRRAKLGTLEADIRQLDAAISESTKLNLEIKNMTKKLKQAEKLLPDEKDIPNLMRQITQAGIKTGVKFLVFKPGSITSAQGAKMSSMLTVEISVTGSYSQLGDFMANLGMINRIVVPAKLKVTPLGKSDDKTQTIKADFVAKAFVFNKAGGERTDAKDKAKPRRSSNS